MGGWRNWSQNMLNGPPLPAPPAFTALAIAGLAALETDRGARAMSERFPGYDVLAKRHTPSWNEKTRQVIDARLALPREPRFLSPERMAHARSGVRPHRAAAADPAAGADRRDGRRQTASKTAATAIATIACRRCARLAEGACGRSTARRGGATVSALRRSTPPSRTRCCARCRTAESPMPTGRAWMPPRSFSPSACCSTSSRPYYAPSDRVERDRLWRSGEPARLCADGFRPARPVGSGRGETRPRGGSRARKMLASVIG